MNSLSKYSLLLVTVLLIVIFGLLNPVFLTPDNLFNILDQISILGIIALGMTVVILIGGIDLSVGSVTAFCGIILALLLNSGVSLLLSIIICLTTGFSVGLINGFFIGYFKVPAFITTLALMSMARGGALYMTNGRSISGLPDSLRTLINSSIFSISVPTITLVILCIVFWLLLKYTVWGKYSYAIGGNRKAAWLSGIRVKRYELIIYSICGLTTAISSIILVGKLSSAQPQAGNLYELNAIAAVVIGGASLSGGKGSILNTVLGVLILGILQNGFSIINLPSYYQQILVGIIIITAVVLDKKPFNNNSDE